MTKIHHKFRGHYETRRNCLQNIYHRQRDNISICNKLLNFEGQSCKNPIETQEKRHKQTLDNKRYENDPIQMEKYSNSELEKCRLKQH